MSENNDSNQENVARGFEENKQPLNGPREASHPSVDESESRKDKIRKAYHRAFELTAAKLGFVPLPKLKID